MLKSSSKISDPTDTKGSEQDKLSEYRRVRDELRQNIEA
jgi:hypothetical protein